jgi:hypothetical protein
MSEESIIAVQRLPVLARIPAHRMKLLFLSTEEPRGHGIGVNISINLDDDGQFKLSSSERCPDDPSTIYSRLPVRDPLGATVDPLGYYPSYSEMTPEQRGQYLRWLCDTARPIEIGYVFVYFYGLERHLALGNFDAAFDEVLHLRKHHMNSSFDSYSESALVHACLMRRRLDRLNALYEDPDFDHFDNSNLLILHYSGLNMCVDVLMKVAGRLYGVNGRYLRSDPDLYRETLSEMLRDCFGEDEYPLATRFSLDDVEGTPYAIFANFTLPSEIRAPPLPDFFRHEPFIEELGGFFK